VGAGGKLAPVAGSLRFKGQVLDDALRGVPVEVMLAKEEIRDLLAEQVELLRQPR
jgi:hypothetical protein